MFVLDAGVDSGPILAQQEIPIEMNENATTLYAKVEDAHRKLMRDTFPLLVAGSLEPVPQDADHATVWPGRKPEDGLIRSDMSVDDVDRLVRAVTHPYPGAYFKCDDGRECVVWEGSAAASSEGVAIELRDGTYWATDYHFRSVG
jgi:methionyl-tRNA formyltransferase